MSTQLYRMMVGVMRRQAGYKIKNVKLENDPDYNFCYAERGMPPSQDKEEPSVLFLHGVSGQKGTWYALTRCFPSSLHCIAIDLPGHGGTTHKEEDDFTVDGWCKRVHEFIRAVRLYTVPGGIHLVGHSWGGVIAGQYALKYGAVDRIRIVSQLSTNLWTPFKEPINPTIFVPRTPEELQMHLNYFYHKKYPGGVNQKIWLGALQRPYYDRFAFMWPKISKDFKTPQESVLRMSLWRTLMPKTTRVHLIWGEMSRMSPVAGGRFVADALQCRLSIVHNAGHCLQIEEPKKTADIILAYRKLSLQ